MTGQCPRAAGVLTVADWLCMFNYVRFLLVVLAGLGTALAEERPVGEVIDDLAIRIELNRVNLS